MNLSHSAGPGLPALFMLVAFARCWLAAGEACAQTTPSPTPYACGGAAQPAADGEKAIIKPAAWLTNQRLSGMDPHLPPLVRAQHEGQTLHGTYKLCVDRSGSVTAVTPLTSIAGADETVMRVLCTWRFKEQPAPVCAVWPIAFIVEAPPPPPPPESLSCAGIAPAPHHEVFANLRPLEMAALQLPEAVLRQRAGSLLSATYHICVDESGKVVRASPQPGWPGADEAILRALRETRWQITVSEPADAPDKSPLCWNYTVHVPVSSPSRFVTGPAGLERPEARLLTPLPRAPAPSLPRHLLAVTKADVCLDPTTGLVVKTTHPMAPLWSWEVTLPPGWQEPICFSQDLPPDLRELAVEQPRAVRVQRGARTWVVSTTEARLWGPASSPAGDKTVLKPAFILRSQKLGGENPRLPDLIKVRRRGQTVQGTYKLCLSEAGHVTALSVVTSIPGADQAIGRALCTWRFLPQPIKVCTMWVIQFIIE